MSVLPAGTEHRADAAISSPIWDSFVKEAVSFPAAAKSFNALHKTVTGGAKPAAQTSGKGQLTMIGRSGTSALSTPPPPRITS